MQTTTNYGLKKPEYNETVDIADLNYNADQIDSALTPTANPDLAPEGNGPSKLVSWVSYFANRIKAITGKANWYDTPSKTLEDVATHLADKATDTNLGHIKKGSRINIDGNGLASVDTTDIPLKTTADMTLYVRTDGNDNNDGSVNDSSHALQTIQAAINKIPQIVNHAVTINVATGTYNETLNVKGFTGYGNIIINGYTALPDASHIYSINAIYVFNCTCAVAITGFNATTTTGSAFHVQDCIDVTLIYCLSETSSTVQYGIVGQRCFLKVSNSKISNRNIGIYAINSSVIFSDTNSGTSNNYGLAAWNAAIIGKNGTQPGGVTAESSSGGGVIR